MVKVRHYTKPSPRKREGEDALLLNPARGLYGVLDGVTPISDFRDGDGHNGAYLAANTIKDYLEGAGSSESLIEEVIEANRRLRRAMEESGIDLSVKHELWASCIAAAQVTPHEVRYAQLGDCMVVARYRDGRIDVLTDNRVKGVSARAKAKRALDRQNGRNVDEESSFAELHRVMVYNRTWMANAPEGYGVANGTEEAADHIQSGVVPIEGLGHLLLVSDGMFHPEHPLETTLKLILEEGFDRYVERVEAAERARDMMPDDRSAVLLSW